MESRRRLLRNRDRGRFRGMASSRRCCDRVFLLQEPVAPVDLVFGCAREVGLHAEQGFEHGLGVAHRQADADGHDERQIENGARPGAWVERALRGEVETGNRAARRQKQRQVNQQHLEPTLIETHDHGRQQQSGQHDHQRIADAGREVGKTASVFTVCRARRSATRAAKSFSPSAPGLWPNAPAEP